MICIRCGKKAKHIVNDDGFFLELCDSCWKEYDDGNYNRHMEGEK